MAGAGCQRQTRQYAAVTGQSRRRLRTPHATRCLPAPHASQINHQLTELRSPTSSCRSGDGDCAACIADAFEQVEIECPSRKGADFFSRNCSLHLDEVRNLRKDLFGGGTATEILVSGMILQAVGLLCLFLMFLRAWRHHNKKGVTPPSLPETSQSAAMNFPLLSLVLLLLAVSPLAAARPTYIDCVSDTTYAANSTYEANLRRLATALRAAASSSESRYAYRAVGFWPNRVAAWSMYRRREVDVNGAVEDGHRYASWAACIAGAFRELESTCPHHREAFFSSINCSLQVSEVRLFGTEGLLGGNYMYILNQNLVSGLIFQAIGFGWLLFLLLQEWRDRKKRTTVLSAPLVAGDD